MRLHRFFTIFCLSAAVILLGGLLAPKLCLAQAYSANPKLVVVVVIDQFRGDYLERYRSDLKGRGFRLLLDEGAWFPDCYYNYANTKTAPGHATLGTGAYSDGHGIENNEWWDPARGYDHKVSSVEDERYALVGVPAGGEAGASPRSLRASTVGDELRLATEGRSRVFGVSLKDRAAILPSGQAANGAFWMDAATGQFITSNYYMSQLPAWALAFNTSGRSAQAVAEAHSDGKGKFYSAVGGTPAANGYELDFAKALISGEKLGQGPTTDMITISLSANDIMGHAHGPDSDQERAMVLGLDRDLAGFFGWLDKTVGLGNVWIALSADHGVAPVPAQAAALGMNAATVDLAKLEVKLEAALKAKFPPSKTRFPQAPTAKYLLPGLDLPYITLDKRALEAAGIDERTAEDALAEALRTAVPELVAAPVAGERLPPVPVVQATYTRLQMARGELPPTEFGRLLAHSYADHDNWWVMLVLAGYQMQDVSGWGSPTGTTHFSPWSYDRHVPLAFYGAPFQPGTYRGRVEPVDLAATLASVLRINQPSAAVGRVLTEALKPAATIMKP